MVGQGCLGLPAEPTEKLGQGGTRRLAHLKILAKHVHAMRLLAGKYMSQIEATQRAAVTDRTLLRAGKSPNDGGSIP